MPQENPVVLKSVLQSSKNFFVPRAQKRHTTADVEAFCVAVIPTLNPSPAIYKLITSLLKDPLNIHVVVVDDGSDQEGESKLILAHLKELAQKSHRAHFLQPGKNLRKPSAINYGLAFVHRHYAQKRPDVILTCDDDVEINNDTVRLLLNGLYKSSTTAAASTTARVTNKNTNLLTRLQALEYHGFTISKVADNGFFHGPLVMQGMFTAFKYRALVEVRGFSRHNLIEDYDITARMKKWGWNVLIVPEASAWTEVPTKLSQIWRQRVRWTYWGLHVVKTQGDYFASVLQDIVGHVLFLATLSLIIASFIIAPTNTDSPVVYTILLLALLQFIIGYSFQALTLKEYKDADKWDWIIRLSLLPETVYSVMLSCVMIGSYLFFVYTTAIDSLFARNKRFLSVYHSGLKFFELFGYTATWGTRISNS